VNLVRAGRQQPQPDPASAVGQARHLCAGRSGLVLRARRNGNSGLESISWRAGSAQLIRPAKTLGIRVGE